MSDLNYFYLDHNYLSGTIPSSIGYLSKLESLDLSFNMLVSVLPSETERLNVLKVLFLQQNRLSGLINALASPVLEAYDVRSNEFTGRIPSSLFALKSLKSLSVSDNCLSTDLSHIVDCHLNSTIEDLFLVGIGQNGRYHSILEIVQEIDDYLIYIF
jgi:Leucine-rich repeat (LRR) protein